MIFGDPYRFAIIIENIPEWSNDSFKNGLFHFCIDGYFFPDELKTSTLWADISSLIDRSNALISYPENKKLFNMNISDAFRVMLGMISPEAIGFEEASNFNQNYCYQASTENINDSGFIVFAVSNNDMIKILGAKYNELKEDNKGDRYWQYIEKPDIRQIIISKKELAIIINEVKRYSSSLQFLS